MEELIIKVFVLGDLSTNGYLIYSAHTKRAVLIDAPGGIEEIKDFALNEHLTIEYIVITHGHFDHIGGLNSMDIPCYVHKKDMPLLSDPRLNGSAFFGSPITVKKEPQLLEDGATLSFDHVILKILHTPGHSPGSISILMNNWLFSGDTIFFDSVGRTDIPLASHDELISSIKKKVLILPDATVIYPGHGNPTTVKREKARNPFLS